MTETAQPLWDELIIGPTVVTLTESADYGCIPDGAIGILDGVLTYVGPAADLPASPDRLAHHVVYAEGTLTPGLIDCHTHLVFGGNRANEFAMRLNGASYEEIARAGGGIRSSVRNTRGADADHLLAESLPRALDLLHDGVTTLEIKSGYGLDLDTERRMLQTARQIGALTAQTVHTTYLAAHALPPEFDNDADAYIQRVTEWLPILHAEGLVDAVDAFCEGIGFSPEQTRRVFEAAQALGLPVKLHADQLSDLHGAELVTQFNGLSADHLEYTNDEGLMAMARTGTVAVLLPGAYHVLRETKQPPIARMRELGVRMAVSTDCNPGTSPLLSLRVAMQLATTHFRMTPLEALQGATVHAAAALGLSDRGQLKPGLRADLALWTVQHPDELTYWLGGNLLQNLWLAGHSLQRRERAPRL